MEDEDEVLSSLVDNLSSFIDFVGGNQHAFVLFNLMESLCKSEESTVRNKVEKYFKK